MGYVAADLLAEYQQSREQEANQARESTRLRCQLRDNAPPITRREARRTAQTIVREVGEIAASAPDTDGARVNLAALCEGHGIEYPASDYGHAPEVARLSDVSWWGKRLRVKDWREYEARQIRMGMVTRYVSDGIAQVRTWHRQQTRELLQRIYAVKDDGATFLTLAELAEKSVSNPIIRRAEMITRAKGLATWRRAQGFTWTFVTLTAPSAYHRMTTRGGGHAHNPRWNGSTPRDTQQYLCAVWARIRAKLAREGIDWSGLRTVEPHSDGTPHWHLCLWCHPADLEAIKDTVRHYALAEASHEPGAQQHRATFEDWRPADGDMVDRCIAYLIAYVSKNLDGRAGIEATDSRDGHTVDLGDSVEAAARVEAWATTWGIRQFQEIGGGPVTAWRELRRLRDPLADDELEPLRAAADGGQYALFLPAARAAGLEVWAETSRERLRTEADAAGVPFAPSPELADLALAREVFNKWGEPCRRWVRGVQAAVPSADGMGPPQRRRLTTRTNVWAIVSAAEIEARALAGAVAAYWRAAATVATRYSLEAEERAVALAPGFFFSRAAPPRALDPCQ